MLDIPIYINNRNRLTSTKKLVDWLKDRGYHKITILDNDSTYQPLLKYYESVRNDVTIDLLMRNLGPWAFWKLGYPKRKFIVTDSDCVPSESCPSDLIEQMDNLLMLYPYLGKVGPSLRLPDPLPRELDSERMNSQKIHSSGGFLAGIDTTFAIYNSPKFVVPVNNLRMNHPYTIDHWPWFSDPKSEEEVYYRANADKDWSHIGWLDK